MRPRLLIVLPLTVMVGGLTWWMIHRQTATSEAVQISTDLSSAAQQPPESVAALGQLEPAGEIRRLAAPTVGVVGAPRIAKLYVDEGDAISAGQELAEFDNRDGLLADLEEIDARLRSLEAQITTSRLKSQTRGSNHRFEAQITASWLKSQPHGSNHSFEAQIQS